MNNKNRTTLAGLLETLGRMTKRLEVAVTEAERFRYRCPFDQCIDPSDPDNLDVPSIFFHDPLALRYHINQVHGWRASEDEIPHA